MNDEAQMSNGVSAIVMLAAIAMTFNVYSYYKDEQVAADYGNVQSSLDNTANVLLSLKAEKTALTAKTATTTASTTTAKKR